MRCVEFPIRVAGASGASGGSGASQSSDGRWPFNQMKGGGREIRRSRNAPRQTPPAKRHDKQMQMN